MLRGSTSRARSYTERQLQIIRIQFDVSRETKTLEKLAFPTNTNMKQRKRSMNGTWRTITGQALLGAPPSEHIAASFPCHDDSFECYPHIPAKTWIQSKQKKSNACAKIKGDTSCHMSPECNCTGWSWPFASSNGSRQAPLYRQSFVLEAVREKRRNKK